MVRALVGAGPWASPDRTRISRRQASHANNSAGDDRGSSCPASGYGGAEPRDIVVFFTERSARIDQPADDIIRQAVERASDVGAEMVIVTGFADNTASTQAASLLSATRAQVVVDRLVEDGINPDRIRIAANGFTQTPLESHRVTIAVSMGPVIAALPGQVKLAIPARVAPMAP